MVMLVEVEMGNKLKEVLEAMVMMVNWVLVVIVQGWAAALTKQEVLELKDALADKYLLVWICKKEPVYVVNCGKTENEILLVPPCTIVNLFVYPPLPVKPEM